MNNLKAGKELNEKVARAMGWTFPGVEWVTPKGEMLHNLPRFCGSPGACKIVKDYLRDNGISYRVWCIADQPKKYKTYQCELIRVKNNHTTTVGSTEELAVCRFIVALKEQELI